MHIFLIFKIVNLYKTLKIKIIKISHLCGTLLRRQQPEKTKAMITNMTEQKAKNYEFVAICFI